MEKMERMAGRFIGWLSQLAGSLADWLAGWLVCWGRNVPTTRTIATNVEKGCGSDAEMRTAG